MRKLAMFLILAVMLAVSLAFVMAQNNGNGNQNVYCEDNPCSNCVCKEGIKQIMPCEANASAGEACIGVVCYECIKNETEDDDEENEANETEDDEDEDRVTINRTRGERAIFLPWQKRNESECPDDCKCRGAVVSCETEEGKTMTIQAGRSGNIIIITIIKGQDDDEVEDEEDDVEVETELELETETEQDNQGKNKTKLKAKLSNGRKAEIKIMPDTASERALERLRLKVCSEENNCRIELKEVGKDNEVEASYELQIERHSRILGIFQKKMKVKAEINAENGEITIKIKKPWWAFIASEPEE